MATKNGIRKPRKPIKPNGKNARGMLMGMALGWHVASKMVYKIQWMIKSRMEAQILFMLMAPFLAIPAVIIAIPACFMFVSAMAVAGISSNVTRFNHLQQVMDRRQFQKLGKQSGLFKHSWTERNTSGVRRSLPARNTTSLGGGMPARRTLPPRSRTWTPTRMH